MQIYCDMDGVLCDFWSGASELTDQPIQSLSVKEIWNLTRQTAGFWENLHWMPGAVELWQLLDRYNVHILSSLPVSDPSARPGKLLWLHKNIQSINDSRIHLVERKQKQDFAISGSNANILIDDYHKNISEWNSRGGIGIFHSSANETIRTLSKHGIT